jgi:hypothetical protein
VLALHQKSNELFSAPLSDPSVVALNGSSVGTFAIIDPVMEPGNPLIASGKYHLSVSNIAPGTSAHFPRDVKFTTKDTGGRHSMLEFRSDP